MSEAGRIVPSQRQTARWEYYLLNLRSRRYSELTRVDERVANTNFEESSYHVFHRRLILLNSRQISQGAFLPAQQRDGRSHALRGEPGAGVEGQI